MARCRHDTGADNFRASRLGAARQLAFDPGAGHARIAPCQQSPVGPLGAQRLGYCRAYSGDRPCIQRMLACSSAKAAFDPAISKHPVGVKLVADDRYLR